ncbi:beta-ACP synthase [Campylobacter sp. FMV-PI01]|uniref:Beta-ACP synthase n=1 Tax=Campylobacter portucalensis TaxID=2608384 RepID=A0A6L5WHV7_9BACT|nr:beta-ketoacyl synthase N-terminal-like domain-containing protein [Campylobacter portucalensis]MSN96699.1 beta-ACP synthase [Campylobacter portucalensis]
MKIYISRPSILSAAGDEKALLKSISLNQTHIQKFSYLNQKFMVGKITQNLENIPSKFNDWLQTRTNQIAFNVVLSLESEIQKAIKKFGRDRVGVVVGTTTSGVEENFKTLENGNLDRAKFCVNKNALFNPAVFIKQMFNLQNVAYSISTACTSGLKAINEGVNLIKSGICKAVIVGGVDSLNTLTLFGFKSLSILSDDLIKPFGKDRNGTNLGEGGCFMLLSCDEISDFVIKGFENNCDAFHITTPRKDGLFQTKIVLNLLKALEDQKVEYVNLHATGTLINDEMEAAVLNQTLSNTKSSGIKHIIGHTLGAAGAIETGICIKFLENEEILPFYDGYEIDGSLDKFNLLSLPEKLKVNNAISLSFAFGGDNAGILVGKSYV